MLDGAGAEEDVGRAGRAAEAGMVLFGLGNAGKGQEMDCFP